MSRKVFFKLIVPNYNNMAYIKMCLDSIVQQTFQNFICVVVDDMSTDMSDKLVEYYERRYPGKVKLIKHTEKKYAGGARNTGLKYDKYEADYIWFIDSDDRLYGNDVLQKMHDKIVESGNPDVLRVGSAWNFNSRLSNKRAYTDLKFIIDNTWHAPWWSCINAKFADVTFQEGLPIYNDALWFAKLLDRVDQNKVVELEDQCYIYNVKSTTGCHNNANASTKDDAAKMLKQALLSYAPKTEMSSLFIRTILKVICNYTMPVISASACTVKRNPKNKKCNILQEIGEEKIIVSMTSWKKRIHSVETVVKTLLNNTIVPDKIILNLATDEFKNKEADLPESLVNLAKSEKTFEIYWVKENTKPYKKTVHTLERFPNDIIITVDDDVNYPKNFIETMLKYYVDYGKQCPITAGTYRWKNNLFSHYGCFSLIKKEFVGNYLDDLYKNLVLKNMADLPFADPVITYAVLLNGRRYRYTSTLNMSKIRSKTHKNEDSLSKLNTSAYRRSIEKEHAIIQDYILKKYKKTFKQLLSSKIVVNVTTYPARDKYLPMTLKSIAQQTVKPNEVILHLVEDEYDKLNLPVHIKEIVSRKLITKICWAKKNTYCFKRYSLFRENSYAYNITIDDDIIYDKTFIEQLISAAEMNQDSIVSIATTKVDYNKTNIEKLKVNENKSHQNAFMGGITCFPPYIFPIRLMYDKKLCELRDKYVKKCDESWFKPIFYKYDIKIYALHDWSQYKFNIIQDTQQSALFAENSKKTFINNNYVREKERNFFNAVVLQNCVEETKSIFNRIKLDNWKVMPNILDIAKDKIKPLADVNAIGRIGNAIEFNKNVLHIANIDNPKTMTEKIRYISTYGILDDLKCMCSDKILLHEFSKYVLGEDICIPIVKTFKTANDVDVSNLPEKFVLKANHGCGFNLINDSKNKYSNQTLRTNAERWLKTDQSTKIHETHYSRIVPRLYAEQYMNDGKAAPLTDYKFLCFNGMPIFCQIINDRHTPQQRLNYYNMKFEFVDICRNEFKNNPQMLDTKPSTWNEMFQIALKMSSYFDFVRVDLYEINGKVYLGELTFTPGAGKFTYKNKNDNIKLGNMLRLNNMKQKYYDLQQRHI